MIVSNIFGSPVAEKERAIKGGANEVYDVKTQTEDDVFVSIELISVV